MIYKTKNTIFGPVFDDQQLLCTNAVIKKKKNSNEITYFVNLLEVHWTGVIKSIVRLQLRRHRTIIILRNINH